MEAISSVVHVDPASLICNGPPSLSSVALGTWCDQRELDQYFYLFIDANLYGFWLLAFAGVAKNS